MSVSSIPEEEIPQSRLRDRLAAGRVIIFGGAGISMASPSLAPSWWDIYVATARSLVKRVHKGFPEVDFRFDLNTLLKPFETQQLADIVVSHFAGEGFTNQLKSIDIADPNDNHMWIVSLSVAGKIQGVVTTNWDTMIERAGAVIGEHFSVVAPRMKVADDTKESTPLIKIHGTAIEPSSLIETSRHKSRDIDIQLREKWKPIIQDNDILVLGYSGADLNFGAAKTFFDDACAAGCQIWWLNRPGSPPKYPSEYESYITPITGELPSFLSMLARSIGCERFDVPIFNRDARGALDEAMEKWSKELHIERWASLNFLCSLVLINPKSTDQPIIEEALDQIATDYLDKLEPGFEIPLEDLPAASFLTMSGIKATARADLLKAEKFFHGSVKFYESVFRSDIINNHDSFREMSMNLASAWGNYGHTIIFKNRSGAIAAFLKSLDNAYLSVSSNAFLIAIQNITHYAFEYKDVRRCMRIIESGIQFADKEGEMQPSIELRLLLAIYHIDRHEIWIATDLLNEATRRAERSFQTECMMGIEVLQTWLMIKQGDYRKGLEKLFTVLLNYEKSVMLHTGIEEYRRYLVALGLPDEGPLQISLSSKSASELSDRIDSVINSKDFGDAQPFDGKHLAMYESSYIGQDDAKFLTAIGRAEFDGDTERAEGLGLTLANQLYEQGHFCDAAWAAQNVLARPETTSKIKGLANQLLAKCHISNGMLEQADANFDSAAILLSEGNSWSYCALCRDILWHKLQLSDLDASARWAKQYAEALMKLGDGASVIDDAKLTIQKITTFGCRFETVAKSIIDIISNSTTQTLRLEDLRVNASPYRAYMLGTRDINIENGQNLIEELDVIKQAIEKERTEDAKELIDKFLSRENLPESLISVAVVYQIKVISSEDSFDQDLLEKLHNYYRSRYVTQLAFTTLARIELAALGASYIDNEIDNLRMHAKRANLAALFADEPAAKIQLKYSGMYITDVIEDYQYRKYGIEHIASYYGFSLDAWINASSNDVSDESPVRQQQLIDSICRDFYKYSQISENVEELDNNLRDAVNKCKKTGFLNSEIIASLRAQYATWLLNNEYYSQAILRFYQAHRRFKRCGDIVQQANSLAGMARAFSRSGDYQKAVVKFKEAISIARARSIIPNLRIGLASSHALEASRDKQHSQSYLSKAIDEYNLAIEDSPIHSAERGLARLGLARSLGVSGDQKQAIFHYDWAISEFTHIGHAYSRLLIRSRSIVEDGGWSSLPVG